MKPLIQKDSAVSYHLVRSAEAMPVVFRPRIDQTYIVPQTMKGVHRQLKKGSEVTRGAFTDTENERSIHVVTAHSLGRAAAVAISTEINAGHDDVMQTGIAMLLDGEETPELLERAYAIDEGRAEALDRALARALAFHETLAP